MAKETKLKLDELLIESFQTSNTGKGGVAPRSDHVYYCTDATCRLDGCTYATCRGSSCVYYPDGCSA